MVSKKKPKKLRRITFGGLEHLYGFSGDEEDYSFINRVTFIGQEHKKIKIKGLRSNDVIFDVSKEYNPGDVDSILPTIEDILNFKGWYLIYCDRSVTFFKDYQKVDGALYSIKEKKESRKSK